VRASECVSVWVREFLSVGVLKFINGRVFEYVSV